MLIGEAISKEAKLLSAPLHPTRVNRMPEAQPRPSREEYQMALAVNVASRSNCLKAHVGAIILSEGRIRATGYNGTIAGYDDCLDGGCPRCKDSKIKRGMELDRCVCVHAEENALASAAKFGIAIKDTECYVTHEPCLSCTKLLIQAGVTKVVYLMDYEYPSTSDHSESRQKMRDFSKKKDQTFFVSFIEEMTDKARAKEVLDDWQDKLRKMKDAAQAYAQKKGVLD